MRKSINRFQQVKELLEQVKTRLGQPRIFNVTSSFNRAYVINLDEYKSIGTHWIALHVNGNNVTYCGSFRLEHIPKRYNSHSQGVDVE